LKSNAKTAQAGARFFYLYQSSIGISALNVTGLVMSGNQNQHATNTRKGWDTMIINSYGLTGLSLEYLSKNVLANCPTDKEMMDICNEVKDPKLREKLIDLKSELKILRAFCEASRNNTPNIA